MKTLSRRPSHGFTLIEVMITVAIIGILAAIAYPQYTQYILRSQRTEGMAMLNDAAARQERYYIQNNSYTSTIADLNMAENSERGYYKLKIDTDKVTTYTLTATAQNTQARDTRCATLTLNQAGTKGYSGTATSWQDCWR